MSLLCRGHCTQNRLDWNQHVYRAQTKQTILFVPKERGQTFAVN